jgi:hypothetical protein
LFEHFGGGLLANNFRKTLGALSAREKVSFVQTGFS